MKFPFDIKFYSCAFVVTTLLTLQTNMDALGSTKIVELKGSLFCREYPRVNRLFRLYDKLYFETAQFPGKYIIYYLNNGSFASELLQHEHFMGDLNYHIFSSIVSISSLDGDYFDKPRRQTAKGSTKSSRQVTLLPIKVKSSIIKTRITDFRKNKRSKRNNKYALQLDGDYDYHEEDIIVDRRKFRNSVNRVNHDYLDDNNRQNIVTDKVPSIAKSTPMNGNLSVRIWGYLDTGSFPLESELSYQPESNFFAQLGYEDFYLNLFNGSLQHNKGDKLDSGLWQMRRTQFEFDCFIYFPGFGSVAITHIKYKQKILRHQLEMARYRPNQASFDAYLKVFYSEQKFRSCVDLGKVVALLHDYNQLTIIDRDDLLLSFRANNSQIVNFFEFNDLKQLMCLDNDKLLNHLDEFKSKFEKVKLHSMQAKPGKPVSLAFQSRLSTHHNGTKITQNHSIQNRKHLVQSSHSVPPEGKPLNRTLFVVVSVICAAFAIAVVVAIVFLFIKPPVPASNDNKSKASVTKKASKISLNLKSDLKPNGVLVPK